MKIFLDTGSVDEVKRALEIGILDGVTTNPSLIAKEGRDFESVVKEIGDLFDQYGLDADATVSAEVVTIIKDEMLEEARRLAKLHTRVIVKIPMTVEGMKVVTVLAKEGIRTNVTLCFSPSQALLAAKAGATYISPFIGRLDDISSNGLMLITAIRKIYDNYGFKTKLLAASIRLPQTVKNVALEGADIVTVPFEIYMKLFEHPLTDIGLKKFLADWESFKNKQGK